MGVWSYSPRYLLVLRQSGGVTWKLSSLQSAQCLLVSGQGVGQASFVLADPTGFIRKSVQPRPMNVVQLWLYGRDGFGGVAWTGYVDEVHRAFDTEQGNGISLLCSSPLKLFEIARQSPADVANLAVAYARNVTGSAVLRYAAQACGYPVSLLRIHPLADSGSGFQQIAAAAFTNPDQQPWTSVISAIQANSGTEWFFDERGSCYYRQVGFFDPWFSARLPSDPKRPKSIRPYRVSEDDIVQADLFESDRGVVTDLELRYAGGGGFVQTAVHWPRPAAAGGSTKTAPHTAMVAHLRERRLVVYAPWIYTSSAAQYLADVLGAQYSAGVAQGAVTLPATPAIGLGSLVDVPALGPAGQTRYYVSSITYQLVWGGSWAMTLGLTYGRAPDQSFPYTGKVPWPTVTAQVRAGEALPGPVASLDAANPAWDTTPYALSSQAGLRRDQAATAAYAPGTVIQIYSQPRSRGHLLGPAHAGEYTVIAPTNAAQAQDSIALASSAASGGYVTILGLAPAPAADTPGVGPPGFVGTGGPSEPVAPADPDQLRTSSLYARPAPTSPPLRALLQAEHWSGSAYRFGHAGPDGYDCSGLVAAAYAAIGLGALLHPGGGGSYDTDVNPQGIYTYFAARGATPISPAAAQPGDLLFWRDNSGSGYWNQQGGFRHVAFRSGPYESFGANGPEGTHTIGYWPDTAVPFNLALDLRTMNWGQP